MANNLTVTTACTLFVQGQAPTVFNVGDTVTPSSPFYTALLQEGYAIDSGVANPSPSPFVAYPVGQEVAYAENTSGQAIILAGNLIYVDIPDVSIFVPACINPIYIEWEMSFIVNTPGNGCVYGALMERTAATDVIISAPTQPAFTTNAGSGSTALGTSRGHIRLAPNAGPKVYGLAGVQILDTSSPLVSSVVNGTYQRTWLKAVAA